MQLCWPSPSWLHAAFASLSLVTSLSQLDLFTNIAIEEKEVRAGTLVRVPQVCVFRWLQTNILQLARCTVENAAAASVTYGSLRIRNVRVRVNIILAAEGSRSAQQPRTSVPHKALNDIVHSCVPNFPEIRVTAVQTAHSTQRGILKATGGYSMGIQPAAEVSRLALMPLVPVATTWGRARER